MKSVKREQLLYSFYDFTGIAHHLEDMARQGWQLEKIGAFWKYRRCAPAELRYAVVYFAKASDLDASPSQEQQNFWAMCRSYGWQLVANRGQMQIFCNPDPEALPIETDPVVQVENIRASMKKGLVTPYLVLTACSLLQIILQFMRTDTIRDFLESPFPLATLLIWGTMGIHCVWELLAYFRWLRRAGAAAREEGTLLPPKSQKWRQLLLLTGCAVYMLFLGFSAVWRGSSKTAFALLYGAIYATVTVLFVRGSQYLMKKKNVSPTANRAISVVIAVAVSMAMMFGMVKLILSDRTQFQMQGHANAETVTYTSRDGSRTYTYDFYRDDLPLTVEALLGTESDTDYSCRLDVDGTPFLMEYTASQRIPYYLDRNGPDLHYIVWEVNADFLYDVVKGSFFTELEKQNKKYKYQDEAPSTWEPINAAPWGALEAYQLFFHGDPYRSYLLCYEDRFVKITFDSWTMAPPTAGQMALVGELLGSGPLA